MSNDAKQGVSLLLLVLGLTVVAFWLGSLPAEDPQPIGVLVVGIIVAGTGVAIRRSMR